MELAGNTVELLINSNFKLVELVASMTDHIARLVGFTSDDSYWIGLAVCESVINAIKHGNKLDSEKQVSIQFIIHQERIEISIRDQGKGFDINCLPDPLSPSNLLNSNGRGIFYMKSFMDEVDFTFHPSGGTVVKMSKRNPIQSNSIENSDKLIA